MLLFYEIPCMRGKNLEVYTSNASIVDQNFVGKARTSNASSDKVRDVKRAISSSAFGYRRDCESHQFSSQI